MNQRSYTRPWKCTTMTCYICQKICHLSRDYKSSRRPNIKSLVGKGERKAIEQQEKELSKTWMKKRKFVEVDKPNEVVSSSVID